jgi:lysozyme family protein
MPNHFERAFIDLLGNEGGYANNPADPGGETMYGITQATARRNGYLGQMRDMSLDLAKIIYRAEYWDDAFDQFPYPVAFQLFDSAVNSGPNTTAKWLQRCLGVTADGKIGAETLEAAKYMEPMRLILLFNAARLEFMTGLPAWLTFGRGWARRIAGNLRKGAA